MKKLLLIVFSVVMAVSAFTAGAKSRAYKDLTSKSTVNEAAYLPPQCYTKTKGGKGEVYNPCYSCHTNSVEPNYNADGDLQSSYDFAEYLNDNRWKNLFLDKTERVKAISDKEIMQYVRMDNYKDKDGKIILAGELSNLPKEWDYNGNGRWDGYIPDCYFSFDAQGFDKSPDGRFTGWRAFAYSPFLGTFWPTNGSTDDVLIRLSSDFRKDAEGKFDLEVYKLNMAVVEAMVMMRDVDIDPVDESKYGIDLNKNGKADIASKVVYRWDPRNGELMHLVGLAEKMFKKGDIQIAAGLFPQGTEFLHSVRYIDVKDGSIAMSPRMKELRYAVKKRYKNYTVLEHLAREEMKETYDFPDRLGEYYGDVEEGVSNSQGWAYQAFIEDAEGNLRPQTFEENIFCMGCHTNLGVTTDSIFSFPRKFDGKSFQRGWYHWTQKGLEGTPEPKATYEKYGERYEYSFYLENNKAGDEFRGNYEVMEKFFNKDGSIKKDMIEALHGDVSLLLYPSAERAVTLNKAYKVIVEDQSFIYGRDANVEPVVNVQETISEKNFDTGINEPVVLKVD
jgi:hypothetical protein